MSRQVHTNGFTKPRLFVYFLFMLGTWMLGICVHFVALEAISAAMQIAHDSPKALEIVLQMDKILIAGAISAIITLFYYFVLDRRYDQAENAKRPRFWKCLLAFLVFWIVILFGHFMLYVSGSTIKGTTECFLTNYTIATDYKKVGLMGAVAFVAYLVAYIVARIVYHFKKKE